MSFRTCCFAGLLVFAVQAGLPAESSPDLVRQIAELMAQGPSGKAHQRFIHPKGIVCRDTFRASPDGASICRAVHFDGESVPIMVRFSYGAPDANAADSSPDAAPRGMAIRFGTGRGTDIMAISHNGFTVGSGEEFRVSRQAIAATDSSAPHPWPIEGFLGSHPKALKFVQNSKQVPDSFATESFYSNNALVFLNSKGEKRAGRYQILPVNRSQYLDELAARAMLPNFLREELSSRLAKAPIQLRLLLQIPDPGDQTNNGSLVWLETRKRVDLGINSISSAVPDSIAAERQLAFDPTRLVDGIELSDDPLPMLRSRVYIYSVAERFGKQ